MKPIPVAFHIGPLEVHTYGIGLAITFWVAYRYFAKRLRDNGYPDAWLGNAFIWIVVSSVVGARALHVIANWGYYEGHPSDIFAIWHGGLSSFGGLLFAVPVGMYIAHRRCPQLRLGRALDLVAPVLVSAWALGRLLGPQVEVAGGGKPTHAWYGMYYAGQVGKRLPVPLFQAAECFVIFLIVLQIEKWTHARGDRPIGLVMASAVTLWGFSRFVDEYFWLTHDNGTDAVEIASLAFVVAGVAYIVWRILREKRRPPDAVTEPAEPVTALEPGDAVDAAEPLEHAPGAVVPAESGGSAPAAGMEPAAEVSLPEARTGAPGRAAQIAATDDDL